MRSGAVTNRTYQVWEKHTVCGTKIRCAGHQGCRCAHVQVFRIARLQGCECAAQMWVECRVSLCLFLSMAREKRDVCGEPEGFWVFIALPDLRISTKNIRASLYLSSFFYWENNKKPRSLILVKSGLGACCLTILILLICFNMFKGAMRPRHTYVCGFKGDSLQDERCRFTGWKV